MIIKTYFTNIIPMQKFVKIYKCILLAAGKTALG